MPFRPAAAAVTSLVGTGISFFGKRQQAQATEQAAQYNANVARQQAGYQTKVTAENARRRQTQNARAISAQRAALAQSGLAPQGTPIVQLGSTAGLLQQEIFDLGHQASIASRKLLSEASMTQWQAGQQAGALRTESLATLGSGVTNATLGYLSATGRIAPPQS